MRLLLESTLVLDGQFGSHLVGWGWAEDVLLSWIGMVFKVPIQIRSPRNILLTLMWRSREKLCACAARAPHSILGTTHEPPRDPAGCSSFAVARPFYLLEGVWPMKPR